MVVNITCRSTKGYRYYQIQNGMWLLVGYMNTQMLHSKNLCLINIICSSSCKIISWNEDVILMCDFNVNFLIYKTHNQNRDFLHKTFSASLKQRIKTPNRITPCSKTQIDNIFTILLDDNIIITKTISDLSDRDEYSCRIYSDFQKTFDTVNCEMSIGKLQHYDVRGLSLD